MTTIDYSRDGHARNRIRYHIVLCTKYRRPALAGIEKQVIAALRRVEACSEFRIVDLAVDGGDHVHLVVAVKPSLSPEQVVRRLKQLSMEYLWSTEAARLKRYYWRKDKRLLWSRGYHVSTVGAVSEKNVLEYVRAQQ